jgi:antirestriction protein
MKTLKEKYDSIDQSKISAEQKSFLSKIKNVTKDFSTKDKEVNDKIEGALDKMIATFKEKMPEAIKETSSAKPKKRNAMSVAKEIRKDGETFTEAKKRAIKKISDDKESAKETIKSELDKLNDFIKSRKKLSDIKGTDLLRDSKRKAKPVGKRISKSGRVYYEYRDSKTDRLSPSYPKNAPYLAGGGVLTDLAGHTGGSMGTGNKGLLSGFSGTHYDGLVGETGAMSSGEMFMNGGEVKVVSKGKYYLVPKNKLSQFEQENPEVIQVSDKVWSRMTANKHYSKYENGGGVAMANQQVIDDASQGYVNYYLGEGASAGIYKDGGSIENQYAGRTPEDVWDSLSVEQRKHFLLDHYHFLDDAEEVEQVKFKSLDEEGKEYINYYSNRTWKKLSGDVRKAFTSHVKEGQYSKGGAVKNERLHVNKAEDYEVRYSKPRPSRKGYLGKRDFAGGGSLTNEFKEVEDFGSEQYFIRDFGHVIIEDDKKIELVVVARLIDLEDFMSEDEIPSEGKYQLDFDLVPKGKHLSKSRKNEVNDEDNSISSVTEINVVNYMGGLRFEPSDKNFFKTFESAKKHLMSKELNDKITGMGIMSGFIMDMPYNRMGKTNWEQLYYILGLTDSYAKGGGVRKVGNREYSYGRNWTNDNRHVNQSEEHEVNYKRKGKFLGIFAGGGSIKNERKHVNHSEDYEVRYAKPRLGRKGYKGARKFMAGGSVDTPKVYVADLEAYNNGKLIGEWLDLSDYNDADELMDAIQDFLKTSGGGEYAIHDYENLPSSMYSEYMGKRDFEEIYQMIDLAKENNLPLEVAMEVVSQYGESALDEYNGVYDSAVDFAEELADDIGIQSFIDFTYYLDISETDRRLLSQEMADGYVDDIRSEDEGRRLIEEGELDLDEFEEADYDRKEEMLDEARENVYNEYYDNWYEGLNDPYTFLVEEQGLYDDESFVKANFVQVDYEKLADALEQDYTFIRHDGQVYVFNIR